MSVVAELVWVLDTEDTLVPYTLIPKWIPSYGPECRPQSETVGEATNCRSRRSINSFDDPSCPIRLVTGWSLLRSNSTHPALILLLSL